MSPPTPSVRAHVVWRPEAPCAVILVKRGSQFCSLRWDLGTDRIELGQWAKYKVYLRRCDLSADGRFWGYFALNGRWGDRSRGSYTVLAQVPWMTALYLFPQGDTWGGGVHFGEEHATQRLVTRQAVHAMGWSPRTVVPQRNGWTDHGEHATKALSRRWTLVKTHPETENRRERHHLVHRDGDRVDLPGWDWADRLMPDGRLVWSRAGVLRATREDPGALIRAVDGDMSRLDERSVVVLDARAMTFTSRRAPSPTPVVFVHDGRQVLDARDDHGL